ncbi:MAG: ABC transporter ATP-binding protein [Ilumatobacteraceae bacterium]
MTAPVAPAADVVASVEDLHVDIGTADGTVRALRGVDLTLRRGEIVALVGESGSGKSVLAASLLGLRPRAASVRISGSVDVAGIDMLDGDPAAIGKARRHRLGAVFQDPLGSLDPTMRIEPQLRERGSTRERALRGLADVGVSDGARRLRQWPHELSGGLRQRVMLAMAIGVEPERPRRPRRGQAVGGADAGVAADPDQTFGAVVGEDSAPLLIVADEPTTALDVSVQAQILLVFDRLRREHGCAVLLVTHDLGVAASIADRIVVLYAGRVCEVGPAAELLERPRHPYTEALLASRLSIDDDDAADVIGGSPPDPRHPSPGCPFAPRCPCAVDDCAVDLVGLEPTDSSAAHRWACLHPRTGDTTRVRVRRTRTIVPTAAEGAPPALQVTDVRKSFRVSGTSQRLHAVAGVSLTVHDRGAVALVGESGCGKTTLLRMACGLLRPDAGTVSWGGGRQPQLVYQDAGSSLTPWRTIESQVAERLRVRGVPRRERADRTGDLLARVGLDRRAARARVRELSGGQRQRAAIARALAADPRVLVCDEPVSALDASLAVRVLDLIDELRGDLGLAVLLVTHDLAAARYLADEVAVMYLGRIVEQAPVADAFGDPAHPYTAGLRAASPTTEAGRLAPTLRGEPVTQVGEIDGCAFWSRCPQALHRCRIEAQPLRPLDDHRRVACEPSRRARQGRPMIDVVEVR